MMLKAQDLVVLLKLLALGHRSWTFQSLAMELSMSQSEVHAGVRRAVAAGLMSDAAKATGQPVRAALLEFLVHGVKYAYPPERGSLTHGLPTAHAAPPLDQVIVGSGDPLPVWPCAEGTVRGLAFAPLYRCVPQAAMRDAQLYELLALVDAIRDGRAGAADFAAKALASRLGSEAGTGVHTAATSPAPHPPALSAQAKAATTEAIPVTQKLRISQTRLAALCRKYGIARLSLFGSASRNKLRAESDVDLMVEFSPGSGAAPYELATMQDEFSAAFGGRKVDIATPEILRDPVRRDAIVPDLRVIYEA